jgi:hypothetical protein
VALEQLSINAISCCFCFITKANTAASEFMTVSFNHPPASVFALRVKFSFNRVHGWRARRAHFPFQSRLPNRSISHLNYLAARRSAREEQIFIWRRDACKKPLLAPARPRVCVCVDIRDEQQQQRPDA